MNSKMEIFKILLGVAVVGVVCAEVASAWNTGHGHLGPRHEDFDDFPPHFDHRHSLRFLTDESLLEELHRRRHRGGPKGHVGHSGARKGSRGKHGKNVGIGAGIGSVNKFDSSKDLSTGIGSETNIGTHGLAEGHKGSLLGTNKHLDIGNHNEVHNDVDGLHKHQVINSDKTIVKDKTTGVNDVDAFHKSSGASNTNTASLGSDNILAHGESGRVEGGANFNMENEAFLDASSDIGASRVAGAGVGLGEN